VAAIYISDWIYKPDDYISNLNERKRVVNSVLSNIGSDSKEAPELHELFDSAVTIDNDFDMLGTIRINNPEIDLLSIYPIAIHINWTLSLNLDIPREWRPMVQERIAQYDRMRDDGIEYTAPGLYAVKDKSLQTFQEFFVESYIEKQQIFVPKFTYSKKTGGGFPAKQIIAYLIIAFLIFVIAYAVLYYLFRRLNYENTKLTVYFSVCISIFVTFLTWASEPELVYKFKSLTHSETAF